VGLFYSISHWNALLANYICIDVLGGDEVNFVRTGLINFENAISI
jgi:hypothetical protein